MSSGYFAKVVDGIVDAVIRAEPEFIASNPDLFPDNWVEVPDMENYPAIGWTWTEAEGFISPTVDLEAPE
jgi:hypothetical protein